MPRKLQQTMKRIILAIIILTTALTAQAQATQPCVVKQYNQKQQKTPLGGVQVEVRDAQSATSANNGTVTLHFATLKPGDRVTVRRITKPGYEIFNKAAIDQWTITRGATSEIVLVQSSYFAQLKGNLTQSSTDNYKKKYEQAKAELAQLQKAGKLKEEEYRRQLNDLEDQYDNALKNLDNYIDQFARIDLSEVSAEEQRILEMVEQGQIDEAVKAYEELDISGKLRQARESMKALEEAETKIQDEKERQTLAIKDLKEKQQREIATLKLAGGKDNYDKVARMLKENALADTTDIDAMWEYADFARTQHDFYDAERFYLICLNGCKNNLNRQVIFQNNLGTLYSDLHDYAKAEEYLLKALENKYQLFNKDPDAYRSSLADTQNNMGLLYWNLHDYAKAEDYYLKAEECYTYLLNQNPDAYRADLATIQNNMGLLYNDLYNYTKAEEYYLKALKNLNQLFAQNPDTYRADLAKTQYNMGILYFNLHNNTKSEEFFLKALENYTYLFTQNPDAYRADVAGTQNNLGTLYRNLRNYTKAEEYYLKALKNNDVLFSQNPDVHRADLASTQYNLGILYRNLRNYTKSEEYYLKALENYTQLFSHNPDSFRTSMAGIQNNLGNLYNYNLHNYPKAEEYYIRAFNNIYQLFNQDSDAFRARLANFYNDLSYCYANQNFFTKAFDTIDKAITLMPENVIFYHSKGEILLMNGNEQEAVKMWRKVLELDPEFLQKYDGQSDFIHLLKEKGLIEN